MLDCRNQLGGLVVRQAYPPPSPARQGQNSVCQKCPQEEPDLLVESRVSSPVRKTACERHENVWEKWYAFQPCAKGWRFAFELCDYVYEAKTKTTAASGRNRHYAAYHEGTVAPGLRREGDFFCPESRPRPIVDGSAHSASLGSPGRFEPKCLLTASTKAGKRMELRPILTHALRSSSRFALRPRSLVLPSGP